MPLGDVLVFRPLNLACDLRPPRLASRPAAACARLECVGRLEERRGRVAAETLFAPFSRRRE